MATITTPNTNLRYVPAVEDGTAHLVWDTVAGQAVRDEVGPLVLADAEASAWWAGRLNGLSTVAEIRDGR